jgi:hypothetical protein
MAHAGQGGNTPAHSVAAGIDAVGFSSDSGVNGTLLVEDGYRVKPADSAPQVDDCDNVVDSVIAKVLALGGNVLFLADGSLSTLQRIALILPA